ncbi:MAG TPA: fasciclin domain-containing protein [Allosphingosinicella sp.]|nr:fasciclin domain-containing protein [Allosphingosinicella sp.]
MKRSLFAAALLLAACGREEGGNVAAPEGNGGAPPAAAGGEQPKTNLQQALAGSADHKTLANAVQAAGLAETLSGAQPYTLFAPTEAAFQKLPAGAADGLLAPEAKGQLVTLLTGHIVPGMVTAADLGKAIERGKGKAQLATVGGGTLTFGRDGDAIVVTDGAGGQARVTGAERLASNGVVHDVDGVLQGK